MRKPKNWQPERDFAFAAETFCLAGETYKATLARNDREGERACEPEMFPAFEGELAREQGGCL
jgi:hypothetical protein